MKLFLLIALCTSIPGFSQIEIPGDWQLSSKQASKMIQYYSTCAGDCFTSRARPDTAKENLIKAIYPNAKSFTWEDARYRVDDVTRYASRNWQAARTGGAQVAGYTTKILKVVDVDNSVHYFDISLICPPPSICDSP